MPDDKSGGATNDDGGATTPDPSVEEIKELIAKKDAEINKLTAHKSKMDRDAEKYRKNIGELKDQIEALGSKIPDEEAFAEFLAAKEADKLDMKKIDAAKDRRELRLLSKKVEDLTLAKADYEKKLTDTNRRYTDTLISSKLLTVAAEKSTDPEVATLLLKNTGRIGLDDNGNLIAINKNGEEDYDTSVDAIVQEVLDKHDSLKRTVAPTGSGGPAKTTGETSTDWRAKVAADPSIITNDPTFYGKHRQELQDATDSGELDRLIAAGKK